jgi:hypothetical protein
MGQMCYVLVIYSFDTYMYQGLCACSQLAVIGSHFTKAFYFPPGGLKHKFSNRATCHIMFCPTGIRIIIPTGLLETHAQIG